MLRKMVTRLESQSMSQSPFYEISEFLMDNSRSFAHKEISIFCFSDDQSWRKFSVYLSSRPMLHFKDQVSPACIEEDLIFCFH